MKFNFRKIVSVLTSTVLLGSTVALAAAASYPDPFVKSGMADVAVVYGQTGAQTDLVATMDVQQQLTKELLSQAIVPSSSSATTTTTGGESVALFTSGTKLYINDSLNTVKDSLTKSNLPVTLADGSFSGDVDTTYTQTIVIGSNPRVTFEKQPTSSDEPDFGLKTSSNTANYIYNATLTFNKAVALNHSDSEGQDIKLFGTTFTIASATDGTDLVLLKTAEKVGLSSDEPSAEVTIGGKTYTVELVSASDTAATVKVTDSDGKSETKEVNENAAKKVQGLTIAVTNADETNLKLSANVIAGSDKIKLTSGTSVKRGENEDTVKGTLATFTGGTSAMTKLVVSVSASDDDKDAIKAGNSFVDPVFGTFKVDFAGLNIPANSSSRENIKVTPTGDDKMEVTFTSYQGQEKTLKFAKARNTTDFVLLQSGDDGINITVREREPIKKGGYVVVGNEDEGHLVKLATVEQAAGFTKDVTEFEDVFSGETLKTTFTAETPTYSTGTVVIGGKSYDVSLSNATSTTGSAELNVTLGYPDSAGNNMVAFPTIETKRGARLMFYEPLINFSIANWTGLGGSNNITGISIPDGDGFTTATLTPLIDGTSWTVTGAGTGTLNTTVRTNAVDTGGSVNLTIGQLQFSLGNNLSWGMYPGGALIAGNDSTSLVLKDPTDRSGNTPILDPAIIIFEEKDDNNVYEAMIITLERGATSDDGLGAEDVVRTWGLDGSTYETTKASDSKITMEADLWGSIITIDNGDSDQKKVTISYPDEQVHALIYAAENAATITTSGSTGGTGASSVTQPIVVTDGEVSSVSAKNLVVIGGSCINTVAAKLIDSASTAPICGAAFTTATGVASGQYVIQTFESPYASTKIATLVAGYTAQDTTNAAKYVTTQKIDTTKGKKYIGTTATTAELQVATAAAPAAGTGTAAAGTPAA